MIEPLMKVHEKYNLYRIAFGFGIIMVIVIALLNTFRGNKFVQFLGITIVILAIIFMIIWPFFVISDISSSVKKAQKITKSKKYKKIMTSKRKKISTVLFIILLISFFMVLTKNKYSGIFAFILILTLVVSFILQKKWKTDQFDVK